MPTRNAKVDSKSRQPGKRAGSSAARPSARSPESDPVIEPIESAGKRRLLNAATIEFAERGFDSASVLAIARRAGVKQPLVNYHFGTKERLWHAVIEEGYSETVQLERALESNSASADPLERLRQLLRSFAMINVRRPSVHAIMQKEMMMASPRLDWLVDNYMQPFNQRLSDLIQECVDKGVLRPLPIEQACIMLTGVLISYFLASELPERMYGRNLKDNEVAWSYFDNAIDVLMNGMLSRPEPAGAQSKPRGR